MLLASLFLSQDTYAEEIIKRASMPSCAHVPTPVDTHSKLSTTSGSTYKDHTQYRSFAGALQYLTVTRPNISYVFQQICLHMHDAQDEHMRASMRIIRYIQGTLSLGLHLCTSPPLLVLFPTQTLTGVVVWTRGIPYASGYCIFLVIISSLGRPNDNPPCHSQVSKLNTLVWLM
ncbi:uncharacterized mitochondrial protein AtMg00810-like [Spinacia oleracea]|uniref:Uncharacterized mitochondrial protein AtMg00810-like n=1 Tax=Spinacia oleracea TaxID=3562 RepID=A0ABM3R988_SPIOL|nr:uncharacterized mitochondrial protein AtMg00810-like [Spinacia oleracea]